MFNIGKAFLIITETQIKTILKYYFSLIRL